MIANVSGWDDPETARRYERFCATHGRYARANAELVTHARLSNGSRVMDLGAGTGRTADAVLAAVEPAHLTCVEPARAMRDIGEARLRARPGVLLEWRDALPTGEVDAVLCGAAIWQEADPKGLVGRTRDLLGPGGVLAFTIPAMYLGIADREGGGADPLLLGIPAWLAARVRPSPTADTRASPSMLREDGWCSLLEEAGFAVELFAFEHVLTQRELRDWMAIPPVTAHLLGELPLTERDRLLDEALAAVDAASFKYEGWRVFVGRLGRGSAELDGLDQSRACGG